MKKLVTMFAALYVAGISIPSVAADTSPTVPQMKGLVVSSIDETPTGLYTLPTVESGAWKMDIAIDPGYATFYSGVFHGDVYYTTRCNAQYGSPIIYVDAFSTIDGSRLWSNYPKLTALSYDLTVNPYDDKIYGFFSNEKNTGMVFGTITYEKSGETVTPIKEMEGNWIAIAAAPSGQLYAISSDVEVEGTMVKVNSSSLHKIDRVTGETSLIGETGQLPLVTGSATIDARTGRMFWTVGPDGVNTYLCEVDLATGKATRLMNFTSGRQVVGLYVPAPPAEDDAPAEVTDAKVLFEGGSLSGSIDFTAPTTLYDGTSASGQLTYTILCNGKEAASGSTSFGASVSAEVSVAERGNYNFVIFVSNDKGASPKANIDRFIGFGIPASPASPTATKSDDIINVSWTPVTQSTDGGYIDAEAVTYTVKRIPDEKVIARDITATSATDTPDASNGMNAYSYVVTATNHGLVSENAESNKVVCGTPTIPWSENFSSAESIGFFTIIDANGDGKTWEYYSGTARVKYGSLAMDDWLISPPLPLEAGKVYRATFKARSSNARYPEKIEARWGNGATVADMTGKLVDPVTLSGEYETFGDFIAPTESGIYHVGLHGISDANMFNLEVCEITVESGINAGAPARPEEMTATADPDGEYIATLSVKAPSADMAGNSIDRLDKIEISRGDILVKTFDNPVPGAVLTFDDTLETGGDHTYRAVAFKDGNAGAESTLTVFVGTPLAAAPAGVTISEVSDGEVKVAWDETALSADGKPINPAKVRYNIYDIDSYGPAVAENVSGTSHTFRGVEAGVQKFVQYSVAALTDRGESEKTQTLRIPVGTPYTGFHESYAGGKASTIYSAERINYGNWTPQSDNSDVTSQDGDGGFMAMNGYFAGYCGALSTGKISLAGMSAPCLRFYSYTPDNEGLDLNTLAISVSADGGEWTEVFSKTVTEMGATQGWHEVIVTLNQYAGKTVALRFTATTHDRPYTSTYIDNINVEEMAAVDLEVKSISAPAYVRGAEEFNIDVTVANNGASVASEYEIELYTGESLYDVYYDAPAIEPSASTTVSFKAVLSAVTDAPVEFKAVVRHADDNINENDEATATVRRMPSSLAAPESLTATRADGGIALAWTAPVIPTEPAKALTDDFESNESWSHYPYGWAMRDIDGAPVCGFGEVEIPGITPGKTLASFFTFSATGIFEGNKPLAPYSGKQYLAAFARYDNGTTDDWAISPELSGQAQTVSFYARSYSSSYPERIQVLYSTGSLEPSDFKATELNVETVPATWTRYESALPEGARYFAIRSYATNSFMLMIDDVTYTPMSSYGLTVTGYNVYRDGRLVNDTPLTAPAFTDPVDTPDGHSWMVTAIYGDRESNGSNKATVGTSSIGSPVADNIKVWSENGRIIVSGCASCQVAAFASDGRMIHDAMAREDMVEIPAAPGVYIVRASGSVHKILVK
ncbi:choice-of-anchor J domain-containing protein [uncultured Muribaculum sp.]|uniref:choice-of-anchor J domain-containing protein n=1 Tax=uncultured Muribaculum sp. TaxID=1918613 RepID=UPI0025DBDF80|nr:choice-of-anchor J domain-containing protein [uncultured Muribaculum sp.]